MSVPYFLPIKYLAKIWNTYRLHLELQDKIKSCPH